MIISDGNENCDSDWPGWGNGGQRFLLQYQYGDYRDFTWWICRIQRFYQIILIINLPNSVCTVQWTCDSRYYVRIYAHQHRRGTMPSCNREVVPGFLVTSSLVSPTSCSLEERLVQHTCRGHCTKVIRFSTMQEVYILEGRMEQFDDSVSHNLLKPIPIHTNETRNNQI